MTSEPARESVYTPFLRRFTDERARDLADTKELYERVRAQHLASLWSDKLAIPKVNTIIAETIADAVELPHSQVVLQALDRCQEAVLALEKPIFSCAEVDWESDLLTLQEQVDLRRFLRAQEYFLNDDDRISQELADTLATAFAGIIGMLPDLPETGENPAFTVPLISLIDEPNMQTERIVGTFCSQKLADIGLFTELQDRFWENTCIATGVPPDEEPRKPLITAVDSKLPPRELIEAYLKHTPFLDLLLTPIPYAIPETVRFEHMHVVAGTGHGKTQTLQHLIMHDLSRPPDKVPSLVIIDSQGDMLSKLSRLKLFDPDDGALADRLVIIDPTDVEHPPALGLFDIDLERVKGYDARYREQIMNGVIELYDYIFGGLLGAELTQKQSVIFRYLARLMLAIPDATILTLKDVMQDSAPFAHHFDKLDGMARDFFTHEFNDRQFAETKKQILRRLWGVLENPTFERLFSNPRNRLDVFDALNSGKIVLVNTAKDFLKAERSSILGRFFIALTFQAALERAAIPERERRPAFLYIDEAADYFDDTVDSLLSQARKFRLGVVFAHQYLDQLAHGLRASIMTNTSIKFAGGVSSSDANALAPNMSTTREMIAGTRKRQTETDFAVYIRNMTASALTLTIPFGTMEAAQAMSDEAYKALLKHNREQVATQLSEGKQEGTTQEAPPDVSSTDTDPDPFDDDWRS